MVPSKRKPKTAKTEPSESKQITSKIEPFEGKQKTPKAEPSESEQVTPEAKPSKGKGKQIKPKPEPFEPEHIAPKIQPSESKQIISKVEPSEDKPMRVKVEPEKQETKIELEIKKSMENQTAVSMTLTKYLLQRSKNSDVVFSPILLQLVLGLVAAGAESQSLDELLSFLKAESTDELNSVASHLVKYLFVDNSPPESTLRLSFANGVWIDKSISFKPFFSKVVDDVYQGTSDVVDFKNEVSVMVFNHCC